MGFAVSNEEKSHSSGPGTNDTLHFSDVSDNDELNDVYSSSDDRAIMVYSLITGEGTSSDILQSPSRLPSLTFSS